MTLIILLIALTLERIVARSPAWQFSGYFQSWINSETFARTESAHGAGFWLWLLTPSIVLGLLLWASDSHVVTFVVEAFVLLLCLGCANLRKQYKRYLNAADREDKQACYHYAKALGCRAAIDDDLQLEADCEKGVGEQVAKQLMRINFTHYCAVMFWFVITGGAGAVAYCSIREYVASHQNNESESLSKAAKLLHILNWMPARLMSFGLLVVGNYSRGLKVWLSYSGDLNTPAEKVIQEVAFAADCDEENTCQFVSAPRRFVVLAKRNILFFLLVVALMTLFVGLR